jgi:hypothetical protein
VKAEIEKQVKEISNLQIKEYLPVSLQKQSEDCNAQINEIKKSLQNSSVLSDRPVAEHPMNE